MLAKHLGFWWTFIEQLDRSRYQFAICHHKRRTKQKQITQSTSVATPSWVFSHFSALLQNCSLPGAGRSIPNFAKRPPLRTDISGRCLIIVIMGLQNVRSGTQSSEMRTYDPQSEQKCLSALFPDIATSEWTLGSPLIVMSLVGVGKFTAKLEYFSKTLDIWAWVYLQWTARCPAV